MTIEYGIYGAWKAVTIRHGACEMIIVISVGPRIISLTYNGGSNILYEDETGFSVANWRLYGGHRVTTAPENETSYFPDNHPCQVVINTSSVVITSMATPANTRLSLKITAAAEAEFDLVHTLENSGTTDWTGAIWAITCIPRNARILASCYSNNIQHWPGTDPSNWVQANNNMTVKEGDFRGKAGWHSVPAWLAAFQPQAGLAIINPEITTPAQCTDGGCNMEVFACSNFIELETLGKLETVPPGHQAVHRQQWRIFAAGTYDDKMPLTPYNLTPVQ